MRLSDLTDSTADAVRAAGAYISDAATPTLRLGVTGLSRAGKTVFITALINALVEGTAMPQPMMQRLRGYRAYLEPQPDDDVARFAYEEHRGKLMSAPPAWPESTRQISQLRITLEWEAEDWLRQTAGIGRRLHVDIVDYPGEWLLDLGLLERSFSEWSAQMNEAAAAQARDSRVEAWLTFQKTQAYAEASDEQVLLKGAELFTGYLESVRANNRFARLISPGRFLLPGDLAGSPLLTFFPRGSGGDARARPGSLGAMLERRFESYKAQVVRPFFERHFKALDRQIVLVDALGALNGGPDAISELEHALLASLEVFRPGRRSWLAALLGRRVDRVLFAATKADHVNAVNHGRLRAIMQTLLGRAARRVAEAGAAYETVALASLRATEDVEHRRGNEVTPCIRGRPLAGENSGGRAFDGKTAVALFPGDLPTDPLDIFDRDQFAPGSLNFVRFQPPPLIPENGSPAAWPHIGLAHVVQYLIGDRLA